MSYIRYFMPMISEASGYGHKGRQPAGRSIVEGRDTKYKLHIWAQDLRPEILYVAYLLFAEGGRYPGIGMGNLAVDEKGKGEMRRHFGDETLCGFPLTDIVAVAVLVKDTAGVISPLCGYRDKPVSWLHGFYEYVEKQPAPESPQEPFIGNTPPVDISAAGPEPVLSEEISQQQAGDIFLLPEEAAVQKPIETCVLLDDALPQQADNVLPQAEDIPPSQQEDATSQPDRITLPQNELPPPHPEEILPPQEEWRMPIPQVAAPPINMESQTSTASHASVPPITTEPQVSKKWRIPSRSSAISSGEITKSFRVALDQLRADTRGRTTPPAQPELHILDTLFETKEPIVPFLKQARETTWISFTLTDHVPPPDNKPHLFEDPFILSALAEFEHLILGMTVDSGPRRYIIGVPGAYGNEARQKARRLGFTQFKPTSDAHPSWGEFGYWLMFVSA